MINQLWYLTFIFTLVSECVSIAVKAQMFSQLQAYGSSAPAEIRENALFQIPIIKKSTSMQIFDLQTPIHT